MNSGFISFQAHNSDRFSGLTQAHFEAKLDHFFFKQLKILAIFKQKYSKIGLTPVKSGHITQQTVNVTWLKIL